MQYTTPFLPEIQCAERTDKSVVILGSTNENIVVAFPHSDRNISIFEPDSKKFSVFEIARVELPHDGLTNWRTLLKVMSRMPFQRHYADAAHTELGGIPLERVIADILHMHLKKKYWPCDNCESFAETVKCRKCAIHYCIKCHDNHVCAEI